jgi:hypothetical protein
MVIGGESTVQDLRQALRTAVRFDADFTDALARVEDGANMGELNQFYRLAEDLGLDPSALDVYIEGGASIQDLRAAVRVAGASGADWAEVLDLHSAGENWGAIRQALRLADEETSTAEILEMGIGEFRRAMHESEQFSAQQERELEQLDRTAARLADQYGTTVEAVMAVYSGSCAGDWGCVRKYFQDQAHPGKPDNGNGHGGGNGGGNP